MSRYKLFVTFFLILGVALAACRPANTTVEPGAAAPQATTAPDGVEPTTAAPPQTAGGSDVVAAAAAAFLANELGLIVSDIQVVSTEATEFTDSCLGLGGPAESCLQALTPGYVVRLSAGGQEYEARTDETGAVVRIAGPTANVGEAGDAIMAAAAAVLADRLGISPDDIEVVSAEETEFSDGCLGLGGPDESCLQAITPGYVVRLSAGSQEYVAHTDATGAHVRIAPWG